MNGVNTKKQAIVTQKDFNLIIRVLKANWWIPVIVTPILYFASVFIKTGSTVINLFLNNILFIGFIGVVWRIEKKDFVKLT